VADLPVVSPVAVVLRLEVDESHRAHRLPARRSMHAACRAFHGEAGLGGLPRSLVSQRLSVRPAGRTPSRQTRSAGSRPVSTVHERATCRHYGNEPPRPIQHMKHMGLATPPPATDERRRRSAELERHCCVESGAQRAEARGRCRMETVTQPLRSVCAGHSLGSGPTVRRGERCR
jgi:hypothetical protein